MEIDEYLNRIAQCPNDRNDDGKHLLTLDFGIYDNFPILFATDYDKFIADLGSTDEPNSNFGLQYNFSSYHVCGGYGVYNDKGAITNRVTVFNISSLAIKAQIRTGPLNSTYDLSRDKKHQAYQLAHYPLVIRLHYSNRPIASQERLDVFGEKAMVKVVSDLCNYASKEGIAFCLPRSYGWNHRGDTSRIVYSDGASTITKKCRESFLNKLD